MTKSNKNNLHGRSAFRINEFPEKLERFLKDLKIYSHHLKNLQKSNANYDTLEIVEVESTMSIIKKEVEALLDRAIDIDFKIQSDIKIEREIRTREKKTEKKTGKKVEDRGDKTNELLLTLSKLKKLL